MLQFHRFKGVDTETAHQAKRCLRIMDVFFGGHCVVHSGCFGRDECSRIGHNFADVLCGCNAVAEEQATYERAPLQ